MGYVGDDARRAIYVGGDAPVAPPSEARQPNSKVPLSRRPSLRLQDFDYSDSDCVYFVTVRCVPGIRVTDLPTLASVIVSDLLWRHREGHFHLYAYCLMPDHLHLALSPLPPGKSVPHILQAFKSYSTRQAWRVGAKGKLWQRNYYDHIARRAEDVLAICQCIVENPVRKGLVRDIERWPYGSLVDPLPS